MVDRAHRELGANTGQTFLVGPEHTVIEFIVASDGGSVPPYNPIFLYGPTGVGKTLLLNVVVDQYQVSHPGSAICCVTAADFARALATARELDTVHEFRDKHRDVQMFCLDNLQELEGKHAAQIELQQTIDDLVSGGRCTYVTSRKTIADLDGIIPSLKSRLGAGISLPLSRPSPETRRAMLARLAEELDLRFTSEAWQLLLDETHRPTPGAGKRTRFETAAALTRVMMELASVAESPVRPATVRKILCETVDPQGVSPRTITTRTARYFRLKAVDLRGPSRKKAVVAARGIAVYLMRQLARTSLEKIGQHLGNRDHSTVLHAFRKTETAAGSDPVVRNAINEIAGQLGADSPLE